jgi:hypothetical protein
VGTGPALAVTGAVAAALGVSAGVSLASLDFLHAGKAAIKASARNSLAGEGMDIIKESRGVRRRQRSLA